MEILVRIRFYFERLFFFFNVGELKCGYWVFLFGLFVYVVSIGKDVLGVFGMMILG